MVHYVQHYYRARHPALLALRNETLPVQGVPADVLSKDEEDPMGRFFAVDKRMFKYLVPTYILVVLLSVFLAWWQERHTADWQRTRGGLHYFAVMISGFGQDWQRTRGG